MPKRSLLPLFGLLLLFSSCVIHSDKLRTRQELIYGDSTAHIVSLTTIDGNRVLFGDHGGTYSPSTHAIKGITKDGLPVNIPLEQLGTCEVSSGDFWLSTLLWTGVVVAILAFLFRNDPFNFN